MKITKNHLKQIIKEELGRVLSEEQPAWWPHPEQEQDLDVQSTLSPIPGQPGKQWDEQKAYDLAQIDNPDLPSYDEYTTVRSAINTEAEREMQSRPGKLDRNSPYFFHLQGRALAKLGLGDQFIKWGEKVTSASPDVYNRDMQIAGYGAMRKGYEAGMARKAKASAAAVPMKENQRRKVRRTRRK
jgi:hypothetical protein